MSEQRNVIRDEQNPQSYQCCGPSSKEQEEVGSLRTDSTKDTEIRKAVRDQYGAIVSGNQTMDKEEVIENTSCCGDQENYTGYSKEELEKIPKGANLGLGSGNPVGLADIQPGEVIVDLGSGAGIDCFLARQKTGDSGSVIGIDMTPQMIDKARVNAELDGYQNVEFRLGEIEHMPVADSSVDLILSNCVINLSVDKSKVFEEAYRILKPGGRLVISDIMLQHDFPEVVKQALVDSPGCVSRAWVKKDYLGVIRNAGFKDVELLESQNIKPQKKALKESESGLNKRSIIMGGKKIEVELTPEEDEKLINSVMKAHVSAYKPNN